MAAQYFVPTPIKDLVVYKPPIFKDNRGSFSVTFNQKHFSEAGMDRPFVQDNRSVSRKGTLRGLHLQLGEFAQAKLVGALRGKIYDVAVDLRPRSNTFGQHFGIMLDATEDPQFLYVPRGFAHGFMVLSETAEFFYKVDNYYSVENEGGLHYADKKLGIQWPKLSEEIILSDKDRILPSLENFVSTHGDKVL